MRGPTRHYHLFVHPRDALKVSIMKGTSSSINECILAKTKYPCPSRVAINHTQPNLAKEPSSFICIYTRNSNLFVTCVGNLSLKKLTYNNTCKVVTGRGWRAMCAQVFKWLKKCINMKIHAKLALVWYLKKIRDFLTSGSKLQLKDWNVSQIKR